jgi:hypothetical protein
MVVLPFYVKRKNWPARWTYTYFYTNVGEWSWILGNAIEYWYRDSWYRPKVASVWLITVSFVPNSNEAVQFPNNITQEPSGIFDESTYLSAFWEYSTPVHFYAFCIVASKLRDNFWKKDETVLHRTSHTEHTIRTSPLILGITLSYQHYIRYLYNDVP